MVKFLRLFLFKIILSFNKKIMINIFKIIRIVVIRISNEIKNKNYIKKKEQDLKIFRDYKP